MNHRIIKGSAQGWLKTFLVAAVLLMALPLAAHAQGPLPIPTPCEEPPCCPGPGCNQTVQGTITSCAGIPLAGIEVSIEGDFGSAIRYTNASGYYSATLPLGTYTVTPTPTTGYFFSPQSQQASGFGFTNFTRYPRDNRANFDGDCKTDLSIFTLNTGVWSSVNSSNSQYVTFQFGQSTDILVPGDYNADGKTDRAVFRPGNGYWYIATDTSGSFQSVQFGQSGDIPVPRDYDGDAKTDIAIWHPSTGDWWILKSSTNNVNWVVVHFGASTDIPVPGDYDGDNRDDIAVWRPSTGDWWILPSSGGSVPVVPFGASTDKPVQADYDGDGKTDRAVWRPSTDDWWILKSDGTYFVLHVDLTDERPVPGDYDGDGKADAAVWSSTTGLWKILKSSDGLFIQEYFGGSGTVPIPAFYIPQ
jgi:putative transposon-encoded protein